MPAGEITPRAEFLRRSRERCGLSLEEAAGAVGVTKNELYDLEAYDEEMHHNVSLATARRLATVLEVSLPALFIVDELREPGRRVPFASLPAALRAHLEASGETAEAFGARAGWDIGPALDEPLAMWEWCPDGLRDVCRAIGVNWVAALPQVDPPVSVQPSPDGV
jgi:transcriptional regulator with XRE-family HTH domain